MSEKKDIPVTDDNQNLVEMHRKARKRRKRRLILTIVIVVVAVLAALMIAVVVLRNRVAASLGSSADEVLSAQVTTGSISTTVSGSGTLANETEEDISVPSSLEIDEYCVEEGDAVVEGDVIATVTDASLFSAMSDTQDALDALDDEIDDAEDDAVDSTITAGVSGRVKYIAASEGDAVASVMYDEGALMILSLDGYMSVDIDTDSLTAGDAVTVTASDGTEYDGTVDTVMGGVATILVTDDGPTYEDAVTVNSTDGAALGRGTLTIHSPMSITGYAGTVSQIKVSLGQKVSSGTNLITLTDTEITANYDTLLAEREDMEEQMETLIAIYNEGGITSTVSGTVTYVSSDEDSSSSSYTDVLTQAASGSNMTVASVSPDEQMVIDISVDETDILSLEAGQTAFVTIDSIGDDAWPGEVTSIDTGAAAASGVTSYTAEITIDKTADMLSGMSASVVITIEGVDDALIIPVDALHETSSTAYVYTEYDEDTEEFGGMVEVTTGLIGSSYAEITSGLSEGDTVYYTSSDSGSGFIFPGGMGGMGGMGSDADFGDMDSGDFTLPSGGDFNSSDMQLPDGVDMPSGGFGGRGGQSGMSGGR